MTSVILLIALLVAINALYVAAEFASVSVPRARIEALAQEGNRMALRLLPHLQDSTSLDRYVAACQIGITASSLVLGAYGQDVLAAWLRERLVGWGSLQAPLAESLAATVVLLALTFLQVVLGELVPKSVAVRFPERVALWLTWPMEISLRAFHGLIWLLNGTGNLFLRLLGVPLGGHRHVHSPEEIEHLLAHGTQAPHLGEEDRQQLTRMQRVLRFGRRRLREVMVPRLRISALRIADAPDRIRHQTAASPFWRFPVYGESLDDILGLVHVKDLLLAFSGPTADFDLRTLLRPVLRLPEFMPADRAVEEMRAERAPIAIVVDEYGGTAGLVTLEILMEEILGDLVDEFDVS